MKKYIILQNSRFGRLTILEEICAFKERTKYKCICECGKYCIVQRSNLISGGTVSCGCYNRENSSKNNKKLKKWKQEKIDEAIRLYHSGLNSTEIAEKFNVTKGAIWGILSTRIKLRPSKFLAEKSPFYRGGIKSDSKAIKTFQYAVAKGELINPGICEICGFTGKFKNGRNAVNGHHDDYNKPLSIRWLCAKCHFDWHKSNEPIQKHVH